MRLSRKLSYYKIDICIIISSSSIEFISTNDKVLITIQLSWSKSDFHDNIVYFHNIISPRQHHLSSLSLTFHSALSYDGSSTRRVLLLIFYVSPLVTCTRTKWKKREKEKNWGMKKWKKFFHLLHLLSLSSFSCNFLFMRHLSISTFFIIIFLSARQWPRF